MKTIRDMNKIILASASPRRKELLEQLGLEFEVMPSNSEEIITRKIPWEIVMELSSQKARDLVYKVAMDSVSEGKSDESEENNILVIGADTIVAYQDEILGKPKDKEDAVRMISLLQGKQHSVYTGVSMVYLKEGIAQTRTFVEETKVFVSPMTDEQIERYVSTGEPIDETEKKMRYYWEGKAGGYGIQDPFGMMYIEKIEGDYYNVMGLPISRMCKELRVFGFEWV